MTVEQLKAILDKMPPNARITMSFCTPQRWEEHDVEAVRATDKDNVVLEWVY